MSISHFAFQASTETGAAGVSTGVETWDILSASIIYQARKRANIGTTSVPSVRWHHLSEMTTKGSGIGNRKLPVNIERDRRSDMEVDYSKAEIQFAVR